MLELKVGEKKKSRGRPEVVETWCQPVAEGAELAAPAEEPAAAAAEPVAEEGAEPAAAAEEPVAAPAEEKTGE